MAGPGICVLQCAWRIRAHMRCTQCSILLHLMDNFFLACICLWQISQIQTFLFKVVGITDSTLALMKTYLDGRQQCVQIEGVISEFSELACGEPQG